MPRIAAIRPVLLSAPYSSPASLEVQTMLPTGRRTTGLVEVTLDDGTTGLGEGYLAVFAPHVFTEIVTLVTPHLLGSDASDLPGRRRDLVLTTGYWSLQGAARHVVSAIEIALVDALAKRKNVPVWQFLSDSPGRGLRLYASGGDSSTPADMAAEIDEVANLGIGLFKIRARSHQADKAAWTLERAGSAAVKVAIDMCQNLADPGQSPEDVLDFLDAVRARTSIPVEFVEEALGLSYLASHPELRQSAEPRIAGGEIVTTARELIQRIDAGWYDIVQPDATVVGGIQPTIDVLAAAHHRGVDPVVHCWGSAVCQAANYHAAIAGGGNLAEWPLPAYPLRSELLLQPFRVVDGILAPPTVPGLGVQLTAETEQRYPFRADATYQCLATPTNVPPWPR